MSNIIRSLSAFLFLVGSAVSSIAASTYENGTSFNSDWLYSESPVTLKDISEASWAPISLPHTWNAKDTVDVIPGYRRAASWYKKEFTLSQDSQRQILHFEGANMETEVYLNGKAVGTNVGGYIGFNVELTKYVKPNETNILLVKVSNTFNPYLIPSQKSDFFIHGGITRDVWLIEKNDAWLESARISTPNIAKGDASSSVSIDIDSSRKFKGSAVVSILDKNNKLVASSRSEVALKKGSNQVVVETPNFDNVALWSPESPTLYSLNVELIDKSTNSTVDKFKQNIGFRWFEVREGQGFFVNGVRTLIRGTHRHEEMAGLGNALSNAQHYDDMRTIKTLGANFVRLGHYPQDPAVYKAADELGLIIWDELPWCRGGIGPKKWQDTTESLLKRQIKQNYNHASIAFWSLGNEMYWEEDFPGGGEDAVLLPFLKKLNGIAKELDTSRLTSIRKYYPGADVVDVFSPSIWAGWYGGAYAQYETAMQESIKKYPNFIHMEYGGSSHVGRHLENPIGKNGMADAQVSVEEAMNQAGVTSVAKASAWDETYMVDLFDWYLNVTENFPGLTGSAQWSVRDFGTPLRPENPIPFVNQKGLIDRNGKPKDAYYVFASYWSEEPICYIESHTWTVRYGPKEGREVSVFCNTHSAELYLNGRSLKEKIKQPKQVPAGGLVWLVPFKEGDNTLKVIGRSENGKTVAKDAYTLKYHVGEPGKFEKIILTQKVLDNGNTLVEAEAVDKKGKRVTTFSDRVYFATIGGKNALIENYGSPTRTSTIEAANGYAAVEVGPLDNPEPVYIQAKTQNFKGAFLEIAK